MLRYEITMFKNNKWGIKDNKTGKRLKYPEIEAMLNELDIRRNRHLLKNEKVSKYEEVDKFFENNESLSIDNLN